MTKNIQDVVAERFEEWLSNHSDFMGGIGSSMVPDLKNCLTQLVKEVEARERQRLENEFGDFAHEHYKGCTREANDEYVYGYDNEVVWLVREFFEKEKTTPPTSDVTNQQT